jgi:hypothetical protein
MSKKIFKENKEGLIAPPSYWIKGHMNIQKQLNGCGPSLLPPWLVPDSLIGTKITESCNIHDWMYHEASTLKDYQKADEIFLKNLDKQIKNKSKILYFARKALSYIYYGAVRIYSNLKYNVSGNSKA